MIVINTNYSISRIHKRLFAIFIAITFLFLVVFSRFFYVQVIWGENLQEKAIDQWTREIPIIANRGNIVDRNGVVLATNDDTYSVFVRKRAVQDFENTAKQLSKVLESDYNYIFNRLNNSKSSEVTIKKQVRKEQINKLLDLNLAGVYYSRDNSRLYPYGELLSSVIGFTSSDGKGQSGLELYYDKYLGGINGEVLYETDIVGLEIDGSKASYLPAKDGLNVKLTIDYDIQQICDSAMKEAYEIHQAKSAKMIVIDPNSFEILALSEMPRYDLNSIDRNNQDVISTISRTSIISDIYEPGSTFKILTSAANVEEYFNGNKKAFSLNHVFNSSRYRYIDGQKVKCWSNHLNGKHSNLNLEGALNNSCNPIFVDIAMSLGKETLYKYIEKLNYGKVTGVDINGEAQGMVLPLSAVKNVDLSRIAFGQTIAVTGLQLILATASIVNGGNYYTPYFIKEVYDNNGIIAEKTERKLKNKVVSEKTSKAMVKMLESVVTNGSGKLAYIDGYRVFGKTGTSQKWKDGKLDIGKYVASFIGGFPANNPQYLALIVIDEPIGSYYGSTVAGPYAKKVFENIIRIKDIVC